MSVYIPYWLIWKREVAMKVIDCCWRTSNSWELTVPSQLLWKGVGGGNIYIYKNPLVKCTEIFSFFLVRMKYKKINILETVRVVIPL
jgi:hypothetical protein